MAEESTPIDFEKALEELENLVAQMERGELTLEESLQRFERGIGLARRCQGALGLAEQKVEKLVGQRLVALDSED